MRWRLRGDGEERQIHKCIFYAYWESVLTRSLVHIYDLLLSSRIVIPSIRLE
jgi:hypothetical protein